MNAALPLYKGNTPRVMTFISIIRKVQWPQYFSSHGDLQLLRMLAEELAHTLHNRTTNISTSHCKVSGLHVSAVVAFVYENDAYLMTLLLGYFSQSCSFTSTFVWWDFFIDFHKYDITIMNFSVILKKASIFHFLPSKNLWNDCQERAEVLNIFFPPHPLKFRTYLNDSGH